MVAKARRAKNLTLVVHFYDFRQRGPCDHLAMVVSVSLFFEDVLPFLLLKDLPVVVVPAAEAAVVVLVLDAAATATTDQHHRYLRVSASISPDQGPYPPVR